MPRYTVNGVQLNVLMEGTGDPLLLVQGFPLDHSMWHEQIAAFRGSFQVIAPDLRGFGGSDVTPGTVTMQQFADDLAALLDAAHVRQPVVLCGLSMGGYIALQFVQKYREKLKGLILCDTKAAADTPEARQTRLKMADLVSRSGTSILAETLPPKLFAAKYLGSNADRSIRDVIRRAHPLGVAAAQRGMAERPDSTPALAAIDIPVLILVGSEDVITPPAEMKRMAELLPRAEYVEISGAGHMAPLEDPVPVNVAMGEFLEKLRT